MKYLWALAVAMVMTAAGVAAELPDAASIKGEDVVMAVTREGDVKVLKGYIARNNVLALTLQKTKADVNNPMNIPSGSVQFAFYEDADNESFIDGLKLYEAKKYEDALQSFTDAANGAKGMAVATRKDEFMQYVYYYTGMCKYRMGDFAGASESFDLSLKHPVAIMKFPAEYYQARCMEGLGEYEKADGKYGQLINSVYPKLLEKAPWGQKWLLYCKLGQQRARLLMNSLRDGQDTNVQRAREAFDALLKEGGDKIDDEIRNEALMVNAGADKYLAKQDSSKYASVLKLLEKPVRDAVVRYDKAALAWMYSDVADSYYGLMEAEKDPAKKKDLANQARFEYMRIWMGVPASPANLCKAYYRTGVLCEMLQDKDYKARALQAYRSAAGSRFKDLPLKEDAQKAAKKLEDSMGGEAGAGTADGKKAGN